MNAEEVHGIYALEVDGNVWRIINLQTGSIQAKMEGPNAKQMAQMMMQALNERSRRPYDL